MPCATNIVNTGTSYIRCPVLTHHFGKSTARVLQQLHYWLSRENLKYGIIHDGRQWIRNSYNQWCQQIKETQDLAVITIRRAFGELEQYGVVLAHCFDDHKHYQGGIQVKSYTIDYDALESIVGDLKKTLISRPRSIIDQQEHLRLNQIGEGTAINFANNSHNRITQNALVFKRSSYLDQMSTPPDQMSTPPNKYISNKQSTKHSILSTDQSIKPPTVQTGDVETIQPDKPAKREIKNNFEKNSQGMIQLWNEIVGEGKGDRIVSLTPHRSKHLNAALTQHFENDILNFERFCHKITTCKFLMGEKTDFKANLDWAIRFENIQKIKEGAYSFGTRESNYKKKVETESDGGGDKLIRSLECFFSLQDESTEAHAIRKTIHQKVGDALYRSWFLKTQIRMDEEKAILYVPSTFIHDRIRTQFRDLCELYFHKIHIDPQSHLTVSKPDSSVDEQKYLSTTAPEVTKLADNTHSYSDPQIFEKSSNESILERDGFPFVFKDIMTLSITDSPLDINIAAMNQNTDDISTNLKNLCNKEVINTVEKGIKGDDPVRILSDPINESINLLTNLCEYRDMDGAVPIDDPPKLLYKVKEESAVITTLRYLVERLKPGDIKNQCLINKNISFKHREQSEKINYLVVHNTNQYVTRFNTFITYEKKLPIMSISRNICGPPFCKKGMLSLAIDDNFYVPNIKLFYLIRDETSPCELMSKNNAMYQPYFLRYVFYIFTLEKNFGPRKKQYRQFWFYNIPFLQKPANTNPLLYMKQKLSFKKIAVRNQYYFWRDVFTCGEANHDPPTVFTKVGRMNLEEKMLKSSG